MLQTQDEEEMRVKDREVQKKEVLEELRCV